EIDLAGGNTITSNTGSSTTTFNILDINGSSTFTLSANTAFNGDVDIADGTTIFTNSGNPTVSSNSNWTLNGTSTTNIGNGSDGAWTFSAGTVTLNGTSTLTANSNNSSISFNNLSQGTGTIVLLGTVSTTSITGTYSATGITCTQGTELRSVTGGVQASLALSGSTTVQGVGIQDINVTTGSLLSKGGTDISGNNLTNISFDTNGADLYWIGGMTANTKGGTYSTGVNNNWSNPDNWSIVSGNYSSINGCIPSSGSSVIIDASSFDGGANTEIILDIDGIAESIDMGANDDAITFTGATARTLTIEGNVTLDAQTDFSGFTGTLVLTGDAAGATHTINPDGTSFETADVLVNNTTPSDVYQIVGGGLGVDVFELQSGGFDLNGQGLSATSLDLDVAGDNPRTFDFDGQKVTVRGAGSLDAIDFESIGGNLTLLNSSTAELEFVYPGQVVLRLGQNALTIPNLDFISPTNIDITTTGSDNSKLMTFGTISMTQPNSTFDLDNGIFGLRKSFGDITLPNNTTFNIFTPNGTGYGTLNSRFNNLILGDNVDGNFAGDFIEVGGDFTLGNSSECEFTDQVQFEGIVTVGSTAGNHLVFNSDSYFESVVNLTG
ncbi:MAG: hypothetical protein GY819_19710, partial [Planctomycetaceae bacterium]|nr:hypothetical protein [Planctomycetaceae bacterium]